MRYALALLVALALGAAPAWGQGTVPIPGPLSGPLSPFDGAPAMARPLRGPFAAADPSASRNPGPLGHGTAGASSLQYGSCTSIAFDPAGRVVTVCNGPLGPTLRVLDPTTLATLGTLTLPPRTSTDRNDRAGGTHFLMRPDGTLLVPTYTGQLLTVAIDGAGPHQTGARPLTGLLASGEHAVAVAAGFDGRDWVTGDRGAVVALGRGGGAPHALQLHETIAEDMATDPTGVYVVTVAALYRIVAGDDGVPRVVWRLPVPDGLADSHAGRVHAGSGTPPAIVPGGYVAVTDGTDPPRLDVARIGGPDGRRLACAVPLFHPGAGSVEAPLTVAGHSIVVANAYGYDNYLSTEGGRTTTGGLAKVVVSRRGCRVAWTSAEVSPSSQPVVSRATGLLYTVIKPAGFPDDWRLAALDWRTGKRRFSALAGEGLGFNSDGGAVALGPDGAAYAGSFGGITRWRDAAGTSCC